MENVGSWALLALGFVISVGSLVVAIIGNRKATKTIKTRPVESWDPVTDFDGRFQDTTGAAVFFALLGVIGILIGGTLFFIGLAHVIA